MGRTPESIVRAGTWCLAHGVWSGPLDPWRRELSLLEEEGGDNDCLCRGCFQVRAAGAEPVPIFTWIFTFIFAWLLPVPIFTWGDQCGPCHCSCSLGDLNAGTQSPSHQLQELGRKDGAALWLTGAGLWHPSKELAAPWLRNTDLGQPWVQNMLVAVILVGVCSFGLPAALTSKPHYSAQHVENDPSQAPSVFTAPLL